MIESIPIVRKRGQTSPFRITFSAGGAPLPLTGSVELSVTKQAAPKAADPRIFTLTGTIQDGGDGVMNAAEFEQTPEQADYLGAYYYEIVNTDAGGAVRPLLEGDFIFRETRG